ncbi:MAG: hypothetical protein SPE03_14360 [Treponema sp.]|nr:hypothetical protein [Treponema sp.]
MMKDSVLCVDIGTTSLKAGLISADGEVVFVCTKNFADCYSHFISHEWKNCLKSAVKDLKNSGVCAEFSIKAIAVSGNGPTLVSQNGFTFLWNEKIDFSIFSDFCEQAQNELKKSLFLPRIVTFQKLYPQYFEDKIIFSGPEFLIYELTGEAVTILPEERFVSAYWTNENLSLCDIDFQKLPPFIEIGKICGSLTETAADFLELPVDLPVVSGGPDFVAALIGTNTLQNGTLCDRCGSSEGFNFASSVFLQDKNVRSLPSVIKGLWNASVLIPESANLSKKERLLEAKKAVQILKSLAEQNKVPFPSKMTATGGQAKDLSLLKEKSTATGLQIEICQCADAELLGDACAGFTALQIFDDLQTAAEKIVKKNKVL